MSTAEKHSTPEEKNVVGYAAFVRIKNDPDGWDVLSFGQDGEPMPEILARRGRVTLFTSMWACQNALKETVAKAQSTCATWVKGAQFRIAPVVGDAR